MRAIKGETVKHLFVKKATAEELTAVALVALLIFSIYIVIIRLADLDGAVQAPLPERLPSARG